MCALLQKRGYCRDQGNVGAHGSKSDNALEVKSLGPRAAYEIGNFSLKTKDPTPKEVTGKYVVV
jgi:hypothetical protein